MNTPGDDGVGGLHGPAAAVGDLATRATEWMRARLAHSPVGVIGDRGALHVGLDGSITEAGLGLDDAWGLFQDVVAPNNLGLDSERFLAFIPMSPSVAGVWMDAVYSAASFSAESWLEGAGAVAAESQVIELLAIGEQVKNEDFHGGRPFNVTFRHCAGMIVPVKLDRGGAREAAACSMRTPSGHTPSGHTPSGHTPSGPCALT